MNLRTRAIYLLITEIGLILLLVGVYPDMIQEISRGDAIFGYTGLTLLPLGILWCASELYMIAKGTARKPVNADKVQTELTVIKLLKKQPVFFISGLFTIIFPLLFIAVMVVGLSTGWMVTFLVDFVTVTEVYIGGLAAVILPYFIIMFVIFLSQTVGFLIIGESLQKLLTKGHNNFFLQIIKGTIIALPYVVVYSFVFTIALFLRGKDQKERGVSLKSVTRNIAIFFNLLILKYYIYANLSSIAFEDKYSYASLKDSKQYIKSNVGSLFSVFTNSMNLSMVAFLYFFVLLVWSPRVPFLSEEAVLGFSLGFFAIIVVWMTFVEQVLFLLNYIRIQHPDCNISGLLENESSN